MAPDEKQKGIEASYASMEGIPHPVIAPAREKSWRSLAKAVSWRITGSLDTFVLALLFTGNATIAATIGGTEIFTKIVLYYLHERAWARIGIGLSPVQEKKL